MKNLLYKIKTRNVSPDYLNQYREVFEQIQYMKPRVYDHISRYKNLRRIQDSKTGKIYHENWNKKGVDSSSDDFYIIVAKQNENRLDMIANHYLNSPRFWWVIALANDIVDPFDIPVGTRLRIPQIVSLYNSGGVLGGN